MTDEYVIFNGVEMAKGWPDKIIAAQTITTYELNGKSHDRIRYGDEAEDWGANIGPCHDCAVTKDLYHVPRCDVEQCPGCGQQAISCDCRPQIA